MRRLSSLFTSALTKPDNAACSTPDTEDYLTSSTIWSTTVPTHKPLVSRPTQISEHATSRTHVLKEFLSSEVTYVSLLREFEHVYISKAHKPLIIRPAGRLSPKVTFESALSPEERKAMFKGHDEILKLHENILLPHLHTAIDELAALGDDTLGHRSNTAAQNVCKLICNYIECMKMYSSYSAVCDQANAKLGQWISGKCLSLLDRKRLQAYLKKCKGDERHSQLDMTGYLLLPVQRLTRYKMLLSHLEDYTPSPASNRQDYVSEALKRISNILLYVNEYKREVDSRLRLCHWADQITLTGPSPLVQPHRILVREGPVNFIARGEMAFQPVIKGPHTQSENMMKRTIGVVNKVCMAVLCHDMMVLAEQVNEGWGGKLGLVDVVRLSSMGEARVEYGNVVAFEAYGVTYYLQVEDNKIAQGWIDAINGYRWN